VVRSDGRTSANWSRRVCGAAPSAAVMGLALKRWRRTLPNKEMNQDRAQPSPCMMKQEMNEERSHPPTYELAEVRARSGSADKLRSEENCAWPLAAGQRFAVPNILRHIQDGSRCVLAGRTGTGKTYVMANVYNRMRLPTVILSYTDELVRQLHAEMLVHLPEDARAGRVNIFMGAYSPVEGSSDILPNASRRAQRNQCLEAMRHEGSHIIVGTTAVFYGVKCLLEKMNERYGRDGWILMIDESHNMYPACGGKPSQPGSPRRVPLTSALSPRRMMLVSATPREQEKQVCKRKVVDMVIRPNAIVNPDVTIEMENEDQALSHVLDMLVRLHHADEESQALLFVSGIPQGRQMKAMLREEEIEAEHLHYKLTKPERVNIMEGFKMHGSPRVLIGTHLMKEGHSFPHVKLVCVLAYANQQHAVKFTETDLMQIVGRATRNDHKPQVCIFTDLEKTRRHAEAVKRWNDDDKLVQLRAKHSAPQADDRVSWPQVALG